MRYATVEPGDIYYIARAQNHGIRTRGGGDIEAPAPLAKKRPTKETNVFVRVLKKIIDRHASDTRRGGRTTYEPTSIY